ncbi:hypothetical protein [Mesobacillus subterraneus]|uniref:Uncharacterized protein n=1 Tax=Mesobacillus subterraneus TaxID=285983 RepID=A0A427TKA3_9BACI|nr:hypothetical protein [Mesobacillus subterraneus]RSD24445.1 hypothetical protein EJA10_19380 [Mesobacillus subterraneus]
MKHNRFTVASGTFVSVAGLLYLIGYLFNIDILIFHQKYNETPTGFYSESRSLLPVIIGLGTGYVAEKVYLSKNVQYENKN